MIVFKKKNSRKRQIDKKFVSYGGYVPELNAFKNDTGYWFQVYRAESGSISPEQIRKLFPNSGFRVQILASQEEILYLIGTKADRPEDAVQKLEIATSLDFLQQVDAEFWFHAMSVRINGEKFAGFPEEKKGKKQKALDLVMPYDVKILQKNMEISGRTAKSILLMGYPSNLYPAFATELLRLSDKITLSLHMTAVDPELCLEGLELAENIRPARKETMRDYLTEIKKNADSIFHVAAIVSVCAGKAETERVYKGIQELCKKFLTGVSELDFQQKEAFVSTLPLLSNKLNYNVVLDQNNLLALCPWSKLRDRQQGVLYGTDVTLGDTRYDRLVDMESGFILSSNSKLAVSVAQKELTELIESGKKINIVLAEEIPEFVNQCEKKTCTFSLKDTNPDLMKRMIIHWALSCVATGERVSKSNKAVIDQAANMEMSPDYMEKFLSRITDKQILSALKVRPFPTKFQADVYTNENLCVYVVSGEKAIEKELAYAYVLSKVSGIIYALDMDVISFPRESLFDPKSGVLYTYSARNLTRLYESEQMQKLIASSGLLFVGEHRISHKLMLLSLLSEAKVYLSKKEQMWITEPAKGNLLITKLASYILLPEKDKENLNHG